VGERIHFNLAPQDVVKPYIVVIKISGPRYTLSNATAGSIAYPRFQFSIFSTTYKEAKEIADAIRAVLLTFSGLMGGAGGVTVLSCLYENEVDLYEVETGLHHIAVDYIIWHQE
jgi:hypothetical protein